MAFVVSVWAVTPVEAQDRPIGFAALEGEGAKRLPGGTTGGAGGQTVTVTTQADLERYAAAPEPLVIQLQGTITVTPKGKEIRIASHKTIFGLGENATVSQGGFFIGPGVHNVILRNLTIRDSYVEGDPGGDTQDFDGLQMDSAHHVWVDHCHFSRMGDGLIDSRKDTDYLTISWNKFSDHNKAFGIGWTENRVSKLTIHHNWFQNVNQRNPSCDNAYCHLFNNFLENVTAYGNFSRGTASMVVENSVFRNVKDPWFHDEGATLTARGNLTEGTITGRMLSTGNAFDPKQYYSYTLDSANQVKALVMAGAGPQANLMPTSVFEFPKAESRKSEKTKVDGRGRIQQRRSHYLPFHIWVMTIDGKVLRR